MNTEVFDLGKIGITLGGEYNNKVIYEKLTIVLYKGKSYISTKTTKGVSPEQDIKIWQLVAEAKDAYHMLTDAGKITLTEEEFLEQLVDATKGRYIVQGNIINAADEEDLTVEHSSLMGIDTLKLADRSSTYGIGYVILRKNKSFAEQVTKENTIYEIRYNFDLHEAEVTIPNNSILKFIGGKLIGGTIKGNNTIIYGNETAIFNNISIIGTWNVPIIHSTWFVDINDDNKIKNLINLSDSNIYNKIIISKGSYNVSASYNDDKIISIKANTDVILLGDIILSSNDFPKYNIISFEEPNCSICGSGIIKGDALTHNYKNIPDFETHEWGYGIEVNSDNIKICGVTITNCTGDGICVKTISKNINIDSININYCRRQGITIANSNTIVSNFIISNIGQLISDNPIVKGTNPKAAIDIEPDLNHKGLNIKIYNGIINNCTIGISSYKVLEPYNTNIIVNNLELINTPSAIILQNSNNTNFNNIKITSEFHSIISIKNSKEVYFNNINLYNSTFNLNNSNVILENLIHNSDHRDIYVPNAIIKALDSICDIKVFDIETTYYNFIISNNSSISVSSGIINITNGGFIDSQNSSIIFNSIKQYIDSEKLKYAIYINNSYIQYLNCELAGTINAIADDNQSIINIKLIDCKLKSILGANCLGTLYLDIKNCIIEIPANYGVLPINITGDFTEKSYINIDNSSIINNSETSSIIIQLKVPNANIKNCIFKTPANLFNFIGTDSYEYKVTDCKIYVNNVLTNDIKSNHENTVLYYTTFKYIFGTNRPILNNLSKGHKFFDTTINKPIYWTGTKWVDATGADV